MLKRDNAHGETLLLYVDCVQVWIITLPTVAKLRQDHGIKEEADGGLF